MGITKESFFTKLIIFFTCHVLIQGLERIVHHETIGKPKHHLGISSFVVHFRGQEKGVAPKAMCHGIFQTFLLMAEK